MSKPSPAFPEALIFDRYGVRWKPLKAGKGWIERPGWLVEQEILQIPEGGKFPRGYLGFKHHFMAYVTALLGDPNGVYGFQWNPNAVRILDGMINHRFLAICGAASSGKSRSLAGIAVCWWLLDPFNTKVLVTSTTVESAKGKIWGDVHEAWSAAAATVGGEANLPGRYIGSHHRIRYEYGTVKSDKAGLELIPTDASQEKQAAEKMQGYKRGKVILIGDEWDTLSPAVLKTAESNLTSNPQMRGIGAFNPTGRFTNGGVFAKPKGGWDTIDENSMEWETERGWCVRFDAEAYVRSTKQFWRGLPTAMWVRNQQKLLGADSAEYFTMVRGYFPPTGDANTLYSEVELVSQYCCQKTVEASGGGWETQPEMVAGLDPSWMHDGDRAVLTIGKCGTAQFKNFENRESRKVLERVRTIVLDAEMDKKADKVEQVAKLTKKYLEQYKVPCRNLAVDVTGSGGFVALMNTIVGTDFIQVSFAARPSEIRISKIDKRRACDVFKNLMSEIWCVMKDLVRGNHIRGLDDDTMEEMCARRYKPGNGKGVLTEVCPKSQMKKFGHKSPDKSDSWMLCGHAARTRCGLSGNEKPAVRPVEASQQFGIFTKIYGAIGVTKQPVNRIPFEVEKQLVAGGWGDE